MRVGEECKYDGLDLRNVSHDVQWIVRMHVVDHARGYALYPYHFWAIVCYRQDKGPLRS